MRNKKGSLKRKRSSKSLRPQRVAARNARNWLSRSIKGVSTDEDVGTSEDESSDYESLLYESDIQSNGSDRSIQDEHQKNPKGKEVSLDDLVKTSEVQSQTNDRNRKKLVLKLSTRNPKMLPPTEYTKTEEHKHFNRGNSSSDTREFEVSRNHFSFQDPGSSSGNFIGAELSQNEGDKVEDHVDLSIVYQNNKIKWGEVKTRTSKRSRYGDASLGSNSNQEDRSGIKIRVDGNFKPEEEYGVASHSEADFNRDETYRNPHNMQLVGAGTSSGTRNKDAAVSDDACGSILPEQSHLDGLIKSSGESLLMCDGKLSMECKDQSLPRECRVYDESIEVIDTNDQMASAFSSQEVETIIPPVSTKFRIRSKTWKDPGSSLELKSMPAVEESECDLPSDSPSHMEGNLISEALKENEGNNRSNLDHGDWKKLGGSGSQVDKISRLTIFQGSRNLQESSNSRMYNAVYKRSKPQTAKTVSESDGVDVEERNDSNNHLDQSMELFETTADGVRRTRSMAMKATTREPDNNFNMRESRRPVEASRSAEKFGMNRCEQLLSDNWGSNSKVRVGLRSSRNRREDYGGDLTPNKGKARQSPKRMSWLTLLEHEDNYRYIPQLGDKVAYLRQGHEDYIEWNRRSKEGAPWMKFEGLRAVEFCKIEELDYSTFTGSGESCCKLTLEFVDPSSSAFGQTFRLTLPELTDFSDFLVEKTRYDASINRNWAKRDKCQVWWRNENEDGGTWYDGRIVSVQPKSDLFPESPWERYTIQYKSDAGQHPHSPWELHDPDILWKHPRIDDDMRNKLLFTIEKLEQHGIRNRDRYGLQKLEQVSQKSEFLNRFPVPLTLEVIKLRLDHNYYRSLDAVKHDFTVMLSNGQSYFSKSEDMKGKLRRLSDWFDEKLLLL